MNYKIKCPCCGYYTIDKEDEIITEICEVCLWQYDEVAHCNPDKVIGANKLSLVEAQENYKLYGVSKKEYIGKDFNRKPTDEEINKYN
ncbi:Cysteine-rich CPCC [Anaerocolumna jejuensis DSM 15929]|uniref:Cysteine-rich CPCC n=1 Tax=Anaerocolumna jejuensis DSM 15929 TaxID=1121322 RepID=A0A1M6JN88_9FIRM|nr:CPCC family cysteine-rich protein [Anaerocolumna jejuensis]SHJ48150.1 Cysteine-rich CPCC [Anaerocolumna jejuensis DSM 15929]